MSIPTTGRPEALTDFDTLYPNTFIRLIITINLQKINTTPLRRVPDIFVLKHESSIFRSFIQPCMWFWKCQASSPEAKQYRV